MFNSDRNAAEKSRLKPWLRPSSAKQAKNFTTTLTDSSASIQNLAFKRQTEVSFDPHALKSKIVNIEHPDDLKILFKMRKSYKNKSPFSFKVEVHD